MESASSESFDLDEGKIFLPIEGDNDNEFLDDELICSMNLCMEEDEKYAGETNGDLSLTEKTVEPYIGTVFNSRDEARESYITYGRYTGFSVRIHHNRRSRTTNMVIGQDFVCSREGYREKKYVHRKDRVLPAPPMTRDGCPAMLRVALRDGVKWIVTKFVKDHNHSLMSPNKVPLRGSGKNLISQDEKDQKIRELTLELYNQRQRCKRQCAAYQEQIQTLLKHIEEHTDHLSRSVQDIVQRVKELENEELEN